MSDKTSQTGDLFNPFPGLRPFTREEAHLFFGREGQSKSVLHSLEANNFVAVIGASGSGKSSLIYCGVIPELISQSGKRWSAISTRPGNDPIANLVHSVGALFPGKVHDNDAARLLSGELTIDAWIGNIVPKGESLLLVIDQFEEIFRYKKTNLSAEGAKEIETFVDLIHSACSSAKNSISVVLTMRSDFIGECSVFQELTDLINRSNYLIPQMTREDFRKAIEGPVKIGGAGIDSALVEQLLDEVGDNTDQLPVLQHALMRTWDYWMLQNDPEKPISVGDYEAIGRMEKALSDHANEAYDELDENQRLICENIFKAITEKGGDNRGVRRPARISRVAEISRSDAVDIIAIAEVFRIKGRTFLTPYQPAKMTEETVIDISHESLMRIWDRLRLWVDEEANSVQMYKKLSDASELYQKGTTGLWRPPDLQLALNWREKQQPTATWAVQYNPAFERAMVYLDTSEAEFKKEEENKIRLQRRRLRVTRIFSLILGGIAVIAMGLFLYSQSLQTKAEAATARAVAASELAEKNAAEARQSAEEAIKEQKRAEAERLRADSARILADIQRQRAIEASDLAESRRIQSDANARRAQLEEARAIANADTALMRQREAEIAREEAFQRRMLSIAKSMAVKSLQIDKDDDADLKALLAYQAYRFNIQYGGPMHEADIYAGLYAARKALLGDNYNVYAGHSQAIKSIVFKAESEEFFSAGSDGQILLRSLADTSKSFTVFARRDVLFQDLAISPDGKVLAAGTNTDGILLYAITGSTEPIVLYGHEGWIKDLEFSGDPDFLYSIGIDKQILQWSITAKTPRVLASSESRYNDLALSPDGKRLAACNRSGNILLIHLDDPARIDTIKGSALNPVFSLDYSADGKYLAAGDQRGNVRIIETSTRNQVTSLRGSSARIESVKFSPGGNYLASSSFDGNVLMWDMKDLTSSPIVMEDNRGFVLTVGFSQDEQNILSGSNTLVSRPVSASSLTDGFCGMISRNFTREEWEIYVGADITYLETCPKFVTEN